MNNIYLIGFMGTGKTTISNALKDILNTTEIDIDKEIVEREKMTIPEIFEKYGENHFREIETNVLAQIAKRSDTIVSCGGGVVLKEENVEIMKKSGKIILLKATPETIFSRVKSDTNRPLLNADMTLEHITNLMNKRSAIYESAKDHAICTDLKTTENIVEEILLYLKENHIIKTM